MKKTICSLFIFFSTAVIFAQNPKIIKSIKHEYEVTSVSTDPLGHILIGFSSGVFRKYDKSLILQTTFSFASNGPVSAITSWNALKYFIFFKETQQFAFIERLNTQPRFYNLNDLTGQLILLATPGMDHSLWFINASNLELIKYNESTRSQLISIPLKPLGITNPQKIISAKNLIYIQYGEGKVIILDQFGNSIKVIESPKVIDIALFEATLYLLTNNEIIIIEPLKDKKEERISIPASYDFIEVLDKNVLVLSLKNQTYLLDYSDL